MILRPETTDDVEVIHDLTQRAFAQMSYSDGSEGAILKRLRTDGDLAFSLVAEREGLIVGHVAFSPVLVGTQTGWFGLGPISVEPMLQRQGIARALVEQGLSELRSKGAEGCVLIGDPKLYRRLGFKSNGKLTYGDVPVEVVQFMGFKGQTPEGQLTYAPAFGPDP